MSEFYRVTHGTQQRFVEADDKPGARKLALADMKIERMTGGEVATLLQSGATIIRATDTTENADA